MITQAELFGGVLRIEDAGAVSVSAEAPRTLILNGPDSIDLPDPSKVRFKGLRFFVINEGGASVDFNYDGDLVCTVAGGKVAWIMLALACDGSGYVWRGSELVNATGGLKTFYTYPTGVRQSVCVNATPPDAPTPTPTPSPTPTPTPTPPPASCDEIPETFTATIDYTDFTYQSDSLYDGDTWNGDTLNVAMVVAGSLLWGNSPPIDLGPRDSGPVAAPDNGMGVSLSCALETGIVTLAASMSNGGSFSITFGLSEFYSSHTVSWTGSGAPSGSATVTFA